MKQIIDITKIILRNKILKETFMGNENNKSCNLSLYHPGHWCFIINTHNCNINNDIENEELFFLKRLNFNTICFSHKYFDEFNIKDEIWHIFVNLMIKYRFIASVSRNVVVDDYSYKRKFYKRLIFTSCIPM